MRLLSVILLLTACSFNVHPIPVDPQQPAAPIIPPPAPDLAPPPVGPASGPQDVPDLSTPPDLSTAQDLLSPPITCATGDTCNIDVPGGVTRTILCGEDSSCVVDCGSGSTCTLECGEDAKCRCKGDGCVINGCQPIDCRGNTIVCNDKC